MEPESDRTADNNKGDEPEDDKASVQSPAPSAAGTPRRALRERGVSRQKAGVSSSPDTNGATSGTQNTGRVLRDRSTRTVPAWLQSDKSDDGEESSPDAGAANRRRKAACPRRRKNASSAASTENTGEVVDDNGQAQDSQDTKKPSDVQAPRPRRAQTQPRAKAPSARAARGSAKPVCKSEPGTDTPTVEVEAKVLGKKTAGIEKKEEEEEAEEEEDDEDVLLGEEEPPFQDDPSDLNYQPQTQRDTPKPRRRPPLRQKEKKERVVAKEKEKEPEIKMEGGEIVKEVKMENEFGEAAEPPRKRGRRRKDDKTPRLPKRRKKPPVQYVRCEMEGCGTVLAHPRYLQHHIKYQHLLKKKYVCPHPSCGRLFRLQKQLLRHAKHHTDQRDYICEFCARAFKSSHNLAVHRMIHTGEKPLQCEICGFTCRQKASLNWHMKKHDADASYQFSCSICGKKFEKKDSVVAHKAKSHPEVLIAEALAANAGALITTPASLLEAQGNPVPVAVPGELAGLEVGQVSQVSQVTQQVGQMSQVSQMSQQMSQVSHQVVVVGQDQSLHTMQVPVTIALSALDPSSSSSPTDSSQHTHLQLQMPLQFVSAGPALAQQSQQQQQQIQQLALHSGSVVSQQAQLQQLPLQAYGQQQGQQQGQAQILHMTFQPVTQGQNHIQQIPMLTTTQQLQTLTSHTSTPNPTLLPQLQLQSQAQLQPQAQAQLQLQAQDPTTGSRESYVLEDAALSSSSPSANTLQQVETVGEGGVVWERAGEGEGVTEGTEEHVQHSLM